MYETKDNKIIFEYSDFQKSLSDLDKIIKVNKIKNIVSIYRGSLPVGVKLSNKYNLPLTIVDFQTRDGNSKKPTFLKNVVKNGNVLILDDIIDSGLTMKMVENFIRQNTTEEIYCYAFCKVLKNDYFYSFKIEKNNWVIFEPWE